MSLPELHLRPGRAFQVANQFRLRGCQVGLHCHYGQIPDRLPRVGQALLPGPASISPNRSSCPSG